jgi:hypothetical protein
MTNEILIPKNKTRMSASMIVVPLLLLISAITSIILISMGKGNNSSLVLPFVIAFLIPIVTAFMIAAGAVNINHLGNSKEVIAHRSEGINLIQNSLMEKYGIAIPEFYAEQLYYRTMRYPITLRYTDESIDSIQMKKNGEFYTLNVTRTVAATPLEPLKSYV